MNLSGRWLPVVALGLLAAVVFAEALSGEGVFFHRDIHWLWYPQMASLLRAVAEGSWPLWDPYPAFGVPVLANPSYQLAYPPSWLNLVLAPALFYKVFALSHAVLAGAGLQALGRRWGLGRLASLMAGAAWMTSGPFLSFPSLFHHYAGLAWMPWVLVALDVALQRGSPVSILGLGTVAACQVLAGSGDMCLMTALLALPQAGLRLHRDRRGGRVSVGRVVRVTGLALAWAAALSAVQWIPTAGILRSGGRLALDPRTNMYWSLRPASLVDLLVPRLLTDLPLSDAARAYLFESREPLLGSLYLGVGVAVLAVLGLLLGPRPLNWVAGSGTLFFLLCALGRHTPFYPPLLSIPPFFMLRYPVKFMAAAALCWCLAAGLGVDAWMRGWSRPEKRRACWVALGTLAFAGLAGATAYWVSARPEALGSLLADPASAPGVARKLVLAALWMLALVVLLALRATRPASPAWLTAGLASVVLVDLLVPAKAVNPLAPPALEAHQPAWIHQFDRATLHRLYAVPLGSQLRKELVRGPASWAPEWVWTLGVIDAVQPPIGSRWAIGGSYDGDFNGLAPPALSNLTQLLGRLPATPGALRLLQIGGVDHVVAVEEVTGLGPELVRYASVFATPVRLYAVSDPLPRAYLVAGVRVAAGPAAYSALLDPDFDPRREVLLERGQQVAGREGFTGSSRMLWHRADALAVEVTASHPSYLVLLESYDPGWRAWVDGVPTRIQRANLLFRAVEVPAGRHLVEYRYRPWTALAGASLSAAGCLMALAVTALSGRGRRLIGPRPEGSIEAS